MTIFVFCFLLLLLLLCVCILVVGFGVDPALRISVFDELTLGEGFDGVTQVQGFHSESRAFHFQGTVTQTPCVVSLHRWKMEAAELFSNEECHCAFSHFLLFNNLSD